MSFEPGSQKAVGICDFLLLRHDHFKFTTLRWPGGEGDAVRISGRVRGINLTREGFGSGGEVSECVTLASGHMY